MKPKTSLALMFERRTELANKIVLTEDEQWELEDLDSHLRDLDPDIVFEPETDAIEIMVNNTIKDCN